MTVYQWSKEAVEKAYRDAGLKIVEWVKPTLSNDLLVASEPGFWDEYSSNNIGVAIVAQHYLHSP